MSSVARACRQRFRSSSTWAAAVAFGLVGCRGYTCVDTATCEFDADASLPDAPPDASLVAEADAATSGSEPSSEVQEPSSEVDETASKATIDAPSSDSDVTSPTSATETHAPTASETTGASDATNTLTATEPVTADSDAPDVASTEAPPTSATSATDSSVGTSGETQPSAGCGKASPNTGSSSQPLTVSNHKYYVKLPQGYDENTPYKVMVMFNPTGNPISWAEASAGYEQAAADAIRVYPHMANQSNGWQANETAFFQGLYDQITEDFCVDKNAVFAGGESSGGEFAAFLGCEYGDLLRGVAPGAPKHTNWNEVAHECKGHPVAIVIWSPQDSVLLEPAGPEFRDYYAEMNGCDSSSVPVEGFTDELSNCAQFDGCMTGSDVYFCEHNDPEYSDTYHGWPHFAASMTWQVFSAL